MRLPRNWRSFFIFFYLKKIRGVSESTLLKPLEFQPLPFWYITKIRNLFRYS